jgi:hypothetical protein
MLLWRIYVAGNKKIYLGFHVNFPEIFVRF